MIQDLIIIKMILAVAVFAALAIAYVSLGNYGGTKRNNNCRDAFREANKHNHTSKSKQ